MSRLRQWTVDAFASQPFRGNPACVVEPFDAWPSDAWMQSLAQENNQAETAFLLTTADPSRFGLRWFTPTTEVPFCGHATLAAAHVLLAELGTPAAEIAFDTRLRGEFRVAARDGGYRLDIPADPPRRVEPPLLLHQALGAAPTEIYAGQYLLVVVATEAEVRGLQPDVAALAGFGGEETGVAGQVIVAAVADEGSPYDVVSRFFAPGCGVAEDPTTGSAHTLLAPLFCGKLGKQQARFHQAFPSRGGDLEAEVAGDRVILYGDAVTVMESQLRIAAA